MKFMLLMFQQEGQLSPEEYRACVAESANIARDLNEQGQYLAASPLYPSDQTTTLRRREGKAVITDGPFAETREQLAGYFVVDVESREEAIAIAERLPGFRFGPIEVRPLVEVESLPIGDQIKAWAKTPA